MQAKLLKQNKQSWLVRSLSTLALVIVLVGYPGHEAIAQRPSLRKAVPPLLPGQTISGAEHPEYFSRMTAMRTILEVLAIQPEDAVHLQRRARNIEKSMIGLKDQDASELEVIVESFRIQERAMDDQVRYSRINGKIAPTDLIDVKQRRMELLTIALRQIRKNVSPEGRKSIVSYMYRVISKSTIQRQQPLASQMGGGK